MKSNCKMLAAIFNISHMNATAYSIAPDLKTTTKQQGSPHDSYTAAVDLH